MNKQPDKHLFLSWLDIICFFFALINVLSLGYLTVGLMHLIGGDSILLNFLVFIGCCTACYIGAGTITKVNKWTK